MMSELENKERHERRETLRRIKVRGEMQDLGMILSTVEGRRFMNWILNLCGVMRLSYSGPGRSEDTAFYEGQRNIGNQIFRIIDEYFPKEYLQMRNEAKLEEMKNAD